MQYDVRIPRKRFQRLRKGYGNQIALRWCDFRTLRCLPQSHRRRCHLARRSWRQWCTALETLFGRHTVYCLTPGAQGEVQLRPALAAKPRSFRIAMGAEIAGNAGHLSMAATR